MQLIFLGTSSMVPTKDRNHSSLLLVHKGEHILFDCGEGTQRQLKIAGCKLPKINKILITHWHGDHVLGLPGLLQSMGASGYDGPLQIYGPKGMKTHIRNVLDTFSFDRPFKMEVHEVSSGIFFENDEYQLQAEQVEHNVPTIGFSFIEKDKRRIKMNEIKKLGIPEGPLLGKLQNGKDITFKDKKYSPDDLTTIVKGKKITLITDTVPCNGADVLAKGADVLISEATYESSLEAKGEEYGHMTAKQAAEIANRAGAKKLILTHFSQRYKKTLVLQEDAQQFFQDVTCAEDFMKINV